MADPILTEAGERVRHAELDPIAVEAHDASHPVGINAELGFVRAIHPVQLRHHNALGIHDTPVLPRAKLVFRYEGFAYRLHPRSYLLGTYGAGVATATALGSGHVEIQLSEGLGTVRFVIADASVREDYAVSASLDPEIVVTRISSISSDADFSVRRYAGPVPSDLVAVDGDFTILIYAE